MSDKLCTMSPGALRARQQLGRYILRLLHTDWKDEEGAKAAQAIYEGQVRVLTEEIRRKRRERREANGEPKPPKQRAKMKPASLGAKTRR